MPLSSINKIRSLIGDNDKAAVNESVIESTDGSTQIFQMDMFPIRTGTQLPFVSGRAITNTTGSVLLGLLDFSGSSITGGTAPTGGAQIITSYEYNALSDDEIQHSIDLASGNGDLIAGAIAARKIAADRTRWFSYSQGDKQVDKRFVGINMLKVAESLEKAHKENSQFADNIIAVATFDDSGTAFDDYDTASARIVETS